MRYQRSIRFYIRIVIFLGLSWLGHLHAQNSGVGTSTPTHTLHIKPLDLNPVRDPIRIENLQSFVRASDSMILVVDPDSGVLRVMHIDTLLARVAASPVNQEVSASEVSISPPIDTDHDGTDEDDLREALIAIRSKLPKGTFKSIGEARAAGLEDGDLFIAHPEGVLGCSGCLIRLSSSMK